MPPNIPWDGVTCNGIIVGFVLAGIIGYLANYILWKRGLSPIRAFFKPQIVSFPTKKTPFQVFLGCLGGIATLGIVTFLLVSVTGASERYLPLLPGPDDILRLASSPQAASLLFVGCIVLVIILGLKASGKKDKKNKEE